MTLVNVFAVAERYIKATVETIVVLMTTASDV